MIITLLACAMQGPVSEGARAFEDGKLDDAITAWTAPDGSQPSGIANYNLGIAWYRKGDAPRAVSALRAAIRLRPRDARAHHNLAIARSALALVPVPVTDTTWTMVATPGEVTLLGIFLALCGSSGSIWWFRRRGHTTDSISSRSSLSTGAPWLLLLVVGTLLGGLGIREALWQEGHPVAVVIDSEVSVRDAADVNAGERFRWPPGTETRVQRVSGDFFLAEDGRGRRGWVPASTVALAR